MDSYKRFVAFVFTLIIFINVLLFNNIRVFAHDSMLNVDYDNCISDKEADGVDET